MTSGQRGVGAVISKAKAAGRTVVASYTGNDAVAQAFTEKVRCYKFAARRASPYSAQLVTLWRYRRM